MHVDIREAGKNTETVKIEKPVRRRPGNGRPDGGGHSVRNKNVGRRKPAAGEDKPVFEKRLHIVLPEI